ncbi:MAG: hypothetical protein QOD32_659 [Pyrinomonadaceae bacterium]|jgi:hypothetical protein|nr:hypothetical protein [Pyrinomonadaceae bacterium]
MATKKSSKKSSSSAAKGSGPTQTSVSEGKSTAKLPAAVSAGVGAGGAALTTFFGRVTPDASPGWNTLIISGLPLNTRVVTVWMTEWVQGNFSHAGAAWYYTYSVQLFNQGRNCRVRYYLEWNTHLATGFQLIFGPG